MRLRVTSHQQSLSEEGGITNELAIKRPKVTQRAWLTRTTSSDDGHHALPYYSLLAEVV